MSPPLPGSEPGLSPGAEALRQRSAEVPLLADAGRNKEKEWDRQGRSRILRLIGLNTDLPQGTDQPVTTVTETDVKARRLQQAGAEGEIALTQSGLFDLEEAPQWTLEAGKNIQNLRLNAEQITQRVVGSIRTFLATRRSLWSNAIENRKRSITASTETVLHILGGDKRKLFRPMSVSSAV